MMSRPRWPLSITGRILTAVVPIILIAGPAISQTEDSSTISARWDSIPELAIPVVGPINVEARHITVREIIQRSMSGELTKLAGHSDMTCTQTFRTIELWKNKKTVKDAVHRVYADSEGNSRDIFLDDKVTQYKKDGDEWIVDDDEDDKEPHVRIETNRHNDFSALPFFLEEDSEFEFKLVDRTLEVDHVIFEIAFRPKSAFKPLPYGVIYIDSDNYRVIHEEYHFDKNPVPLFLKGVRRFSRHWAELPGGEWVFTRIMADVDLRSDPFGMIPQNVSIALVRDQFRFDEGYDPALFGDFDGPIQTAGSSTEGPISVEDAPSTGLLAELQRHDSSFYREETRAADLDFRNATIAVHDSLGLERFIRAMDRRSRLLGVDFGLPAELWNYNRVEGLVVAGRAGLEHRGGAALEFSGGYATASKAFRYLGALDVPKEFGDWRLSLFANYGDRVVPYGSNRPTLNSVRAIIAGADEQDYLRSEKGTAGLSLARSQGLRIRMAYGVDRQTSIAANTDFSFFGDMASVNAPVDEGYDRAVEVELAFEFTRQLQVMLTQRVSGGELGGDFRYNRTDVTLEARRFVIGRHELVANVAAVVTGDTPPVQQLADVGGLSTVRGYRRRSRVGKSSLATRLEYLIPYDLMRLTRIPVLERSALQFVPWADAGRVWDGNVDSWVHSVGLGVQRYFGPFERASNLRLDVAFPMGKRERGDVSVILHFTSGLF